jgi:hypothetical protein
MVEVTMIARPIGRLTDRGRVEAVIWGAYEAGLVQPGR